MVLNWTEPWKHDFCNNNAYAIRIRTRCNIKKYGLHHLTEQHNILPFQLCVSVLFFSLRLRLFFISLFLSISVLSLNPFTFWVWFFIYHISCSMSNFLSIFVMSLSVFVFLCQCPIIFFYNFLCESGYHEVKFENIIYFGISSWARTRTWTYFQKKKKKKVKLKQLKK